MAYEYGTTCKHHIQHIISLFNIIETHLQVDLHQSSSTACDLYALCFIKSLRQGYLC